MINKRDTIQKIRCAHSEIKYNMFKLITTHIEEMKMIRLTLLVGMACLSVNAFAVTLGDLNSALNRTNQQTAEVSPKMLYGGQDIISPTVVDQTTKSVSTKIS